MAELTIESLGISKEELADRIVSRAVDQLLSTVVRGEDDDEQSEVLSPFAQAMQDHIKQKIDESIEQIAAKNVLPNVTSYVEGLCLQETNKWGERVGKSMTFTEYLVSRAEQYLTEEVSYNGKTKAEDSYNWRKSTTRIVYLVHEHLQYSIKIAMEQALKTANNSIVSGLEGAVKIALQETLSGLKVNVKT